MKLKIFLLTLILGSVIIITGCTQQQQQQLTNTLTNNEQGQLKNDDLIDDDSIENDGSKEDDSMDDDDILEDDDLTNDDSLTNDDRSEDEDSVNDDSMTEDNEVKTFNLTAKNFSFSQQEIRVEKGDKVKIVLISEQGFHDWTIDKFNARTSQINTGQTSEVEFIADKAGLFEYYCSIGTHRQMGMVGKLIVE
ncbi:MAG: hypothetical protein A2731_01145 [Candidatus Buchananbacteria bacterium RIFCSPHIGHO2_01_FULL_39_8]|uniref:EfeO-type cupredoxin-like domain-containing protein n=1 Tax=Candidatus Buchananbacteria bacterium RIFCSPHIGHO2_01_FULL_39_8 TaxID=1797533 RepID=A0A1G1Y1J9_9BACT|nr:MAG: hypothetical protein A2731_01145 [Candidatus Buchananbacteria bacterium RIFCSPHIGHO2_01_FULL_39_8]